MTQLAKLAELAKDTSIAGRKNLIGTLTDMYLAAGDARGDKVSFLFGDIALKILGQLEEETRATLAERVSQDYCAPHQLMLQLARDAISVAEPVLQYSPVLEAQDLIDIASSASMQHLGAIAGRETVEQAVTSVLVDRGDQTVLSAVAENKGADFAESSLLSLLEKAGDDELVQAALITRTDLPDKVGRQLLPKLTDELKQQVKAFGGGNRLAQLMTESSVESDKETAKKLELVRAQINALIKDIRGGKVLADEAIRRFARSGQAMELGLLLAGLSKLPYQAVSQLLFSVNDKPLVILCKAIGVTAEAYKDVLMMRAQRSPIGGMEMNDAIQRFGLMSVDGAKRSLEVLQQSCQPSAPEPAPAENTKRKPAGPRKSVPFAAHR